MELPKLLLCFAHEDVLKTKDTLICLRCNRIAEPSKSTETPCKAHYVLESSGFKGTPVILGTATEYQYR